MALLTQRFVRTLVLVMLLVSPLLAQAGCSCEPDAPPLPAPLAVVPCNAQSASAPPSPAFDPKSKTIKWSVK